MAEIPSNTGSFDEADLLHHLLVNIPDRIYFKDLQSRFIRINPAMAAKFKLRDPADAIGKTDFDIHSKEHAQEALAEEQEIIRTGKPLVGKVQHVVFPDGREGWSLATKMPLRDASGAIVGTFGITRDYTELKQSQDAVAHAHEAMKKSYEELKQTQIQLIEAEKMSSVGRLAAGLAHEINNPLAMIKTGVEYLTTLPKLAKDPDTASVLGIINGGVDRADGMVKRLLAFAAPRGLKQEKVKVDALVLRALEFLEHEISQSKVTVVKIFDPEIPAVTLDPDRITQVLIHLITNALQSMPDGGTLSIRTQVRQLHLDAATRDKGDRIGRHLRDGDRVIAVDIEDTGGGISEENMGKIFEPFFTTRPTGEAVGLGLTVSRKIMELHHGILEVQNRPECGVRAMILLKLDV